MRWVPVSAPSIISSISRCSSQQEFIMYLYFVKQITKVIYLPFRKIRNIHVKVRREKKKKNTRNHLLSKHPKTINILEKAIPYILVSYKY